MAKKIKWNESGFRPPLCTYRLNWARRTSWGWWDDWDDTVLQTQDSKFEPWRSEAEHATSRSRRFPTILTFTRGWGRNNFCFFQTAGTGNRTPWRAAVLTTTPGPPPFSMARHKRSVVMWHWVCHRSRHVMWLADVCVIVSEITQDIYVVNLLIRLTGHLVNGWEITSKHVMLVKFSKSVQHCINGLQTVCLHWGGVYNGCIPDQACDAGPLPLATNSQRWWIIWDICDFVNGVDYRQWSVLEKRNYYRGNLTITIKSLFTVFRNTAKEIGGGGRGDGWRQLGDRKQVQMPLQTYCWFQQKQEIDKLLVYSWTSVVGVRPTSK